MPTFTYASYAKALDRLKMDLSPREMRKVSKAMAERGEKIAANAARGAVGGDAKHSGWGFPLDTKVRPAGDSGVVMTPTRRSAGPWTEIEVGRNASGGVGRFQGPGVNMRTGRTSRRRDGTVSTANRRRTGVRYNGRTPARGAASDAVGQMERETPKIAEREIKRIIRKRVDLT